MKTDCRVTMVFLIVHSVSCLFQHDYDYYELDPDDDESWRYNPITSIAHKNGTILIADKEGVHLPGSTSFLWLESLDLTLMKKILLSSLAREVDVKHQENSDYMIISVIYSDYISFYLLHLPKSTSLVHDALETHRLTRPEVTGVIVIHNGDPGSHEYVTAYVLLAPFEVSQETRLSFRPDLLLVRYFELSTKNHSLVFRNETLLQISRSVTDEPLREFIYVFEQGNYSYLIGMDRSRSDGSVIGANIMRSYRFDSTLHSSTTVRLVCEKHRRPVSAYYPASTVIKPPMDPNYFYIAFQHDNSSESLVCGYSLLRLNNLLDSERQACYRAKASNRVRTSPIFSDGTPCIVEKMSTFATGSNIFIESQAVLKPEPNMIKRCNHLILHLLVASYSSINYTVFIYLVQGGPLIETSNLMYRFYREHCPRNLTKPVFDSLGLVVHYGCDDKINSVPLSTCETFRYQQQCEQNAQQLPCSWNEFANQCSKSNKKNEISRRSSSEESTSKAGNSLSNSKKPEMGPHNEEKLTTFHASSVQPDFENSIDTKSNDLYSEEDYLNDFEPGLIVGGSHSDTNDDDENVNNNKFITKLGDSKGKFQSKSIAEPDEAKVTVTKIKLRSSEGFQNGIGTETEKLLVILVSLGVIMGAILLFAISKIRQGRSRPS